MVGCVSPKAKTVSRGLRLQSRCCSAVCGLHWGFIGLHVVNLSLTPFPPLPCPWPDDAVLALSRYSPKTLTSCQTVPLLLPNRVSFMTVFTGTERLRSVNHPSAHQKDSKYWHLCITYALHNYFWSILGSRNVIRISDNKYHQLIFHLLLIIIHNTHK